MAQHFTSQLWQLPTRSRRFSNLDVALLMALSLRIHGTGQSIRKLANNLRTGVVIEHQAGMKRLAKAPDGPALGCALNIVNATTDLLGIEVGKRFELTPVEVPRCHYKPMRLAGESGARHWQCQHCSHTKPVELSA